jgi:hypothetical protein
VGSLHRRIKNLERNTPQLSSREDSDWLTDDLRAERDAEVMRKLQRVIEQAEAKGERSSLTEEENEAALESLREAIRRDAATREERPWAI